MVQPTIWVVWGGVFTNSEFLQLEPGTEELHGPYHDRAAAVKVWREQMQRKIDIATHRLIIMRATASGPDEA